MMFPLDFDGQIYVLQDEMGNTIGTGSHQVCRVLLQIITRPLTARIPPDTDGSQQSNVRVEINI
jgi:hypothetical protein